MVAFLKIAWAFATSKLGLGLIAGVALLIVVGGHFAHDRHVESDRAKWRHAAETWQSNAHAWKANSATYQGAIGVQNDAITHWANVAAARAEAARKAQQHERRVTASLRGRIDAMASQRAHKGETPDQACGRILREGVAHD